MAWRNSRFSRSSAFSRSRSSVVSPGRAPRSRSERRTHSRSVSALQPTFSAIERIAALCEPCSASCSRTSRTARSRSSIGYGFVGFLVSMDPILPKVGASGKPGAVHKRIALRCEKTRTNFASFVALAIGFILVQFVHTA